MPRGFRKDLTLTQLAHEGMSSLFPGVMADSRSFVSLPKATPHTNGKEEPHLILYGRKDKGRIRELIFHLNRLMNGENRCYKCGDKVVESADDDRPYPIGQWHHEYDRAGERCDCPEAAKVSCPRCHAAVHVYPQFGMGNPVEGEMSK